MKRREFITLLGGTAAAPSMLWPLAARAQQPLVPVIRWLSNWTPQENPYYLAAFLQGLKDAGFVEGQNTTIEYRWPKNETEHLPALAADMVRRQVSVIVAADTDSGFAAKAATSTVPTVFVTGGDPVNLGFVASLNRPGGNMTGVSFFSTATVAKRLELLHEVVPKAAVIGFLVNPTATNAYQNMQEREAQDAARTLGFQLLVLHASDEREIDAAFVTLMERLAEALLIDGNGFFSSRHAQLAALAARHKIPAISQFREFAMDGGLMSYGASQREAFRQGGIYVGRILKGTKPADLPVMQPTRLELVINRKTAKALGLDIPPGILAIADAVIE